MTNIKKSLFYTRKFILLFIPLFFGFVSPVYAVNITLQWVPNSEPNLAGYRVFSRGEGQSYDYNNPSLEVPDASCNINNLDENITYYFVIRAFDTKGFESGDSNEVRLEAATTPNNQAPDVDAGSGQTIILPADTVVLDATCTDDGLPNGTLNSRWRQVSGPGTVTFGDAGVEDTTATFPASGLYVLRLTVEDTELSTSDDIQVSVSAEPINLAPVVNAGPDQTITLPVDNVLLEASVSDDGLPDGVLTTMWNQLSGPANQVLFDNAYAIQTTATFLSSGTYVLQLTADDGELTASEQIAITVNEKGNVFTSEVQVATGSDDAEESASGYMKLTSPDLELVYDGGGNLTVGIRFNSVDVPQDATIVDAYVQFKVDETSSGATSLTIEGEDIDNALTFISSSSNISSRARTSANVSWSPVPWATVGEAGPDQQTPDVSQIIQEIVSRPGWSRGNSLALIITGTGKRVAESYDGDQSGAPMLHVEYTRGTPVNQASVIDAGPNRTIILPADTVVLDATCTDDGLPNGTLNFQWSQVSGPGTVTFGDAGVEDTTATFSASGFYVLRLTVDDTELSTNDDIQVTVSTEPINLAPLVNAGSDQTITLPVDNVLLKASVSDDGLPTGVLTTVWNQLSGPANQVVFDNAYAIQTTATFLSAGTYVLQLTADDGELTAGDQVTITSTAGGYNGPYQQDSGSNGIVSIEAENFDLNVSQNGHDWIPVFPGGYSGSGAMQALPNIETNNNTGYVTNSPRLDFIVNFVKTGTHYVWIRGIGANGDDDSAHVGLDGIGLSTSKRISTFKRSWTWSKSTMDGPVATINVSSAGVHTVNVWMREDGFVLDKLVLTVSGSYTPTSEGPAESPRASQ